MRSCWPRIQGCAVAPFLQGWAGFSANSYWRHFRDWKGSVQLEQLNAVGLDLYGKLCATTLAKAHARSGDRGALAAYMAEGKSFDKAIAAYGLAYAEQSHSDYQQLITAIATRRMTASR
ncbi:MAG: DUF2252 domain-containing protein [Synechococcaceae bacterium WB9_2_170]|nr:DUF2252 domain-containing protein [Synechococcaceae bacterium WB9_2_170]